MSTFLQDVRFALAMLRRRPGFTLVVVLVLALGIGANTTIFNLVSSMLIRPLPYEAPERLVALHESQPEKGSFWGALSWPTYRDWSRDSRSFQSVAAYARHNYNAATDRQPVRVEGAYATGNLFSTLGVRPALGRDFTPGEEESGASLVLLGHRLWQERFGGDPSVVGRTLRLDDQVHEVVGVMPEGFAFPEWAELWTLIDPGESAENRSHRWLDAIARLAPGVEVEGARGELQALADRLAESHPETLEGWSAVVRPLRAELMPSGPRLGLTMMLVGGLFVLMIVATNVAALFLALSATRGQEIAVRFALGAGRWRMVRQMLTESVVLAAMAGVAGVGVSLVGIWLIERSVPVKIPFWIHFSLDHRVLLFTAGAALLAVLIFGLAPAVKAARPNQFEALREGGRGGRANPAKSRFFQGLVAFELALSLVMLISSMLLIRTLSALEDADPGFEPAGMLTMRLSLNLEEYADRDRRGRMLEETVVALEALPGVKHAAAVEYLPISQEGYSTTPVIAEGRAVEPGQEPEATHHAATAGYLETAGIPVLQGRDMTPREAADGAPVAVLSRSLAQLLWPGESPLGRRIRTSRDAEGEWLTVVGVAGDVRPNYQTVGVDPWPDHQVYVPHPRSFFPNMTLVLRTRGDAAELAGAARGVLAETAPNVPIYHLFTMEQVIARVLWQPRFWAELFTAFGLLALVIAAVGVYGTTAYTIRQRRREIAIRTAMGADPKQILKLLLGKHLRLTLAGVAAGLLLAVLAGRSLAALLYGVSPTDPLVFGGVTLLLLTIAVASSLPPTLRALKIQPVNALRED